MHPDSVSEDFIKIKVTKNSHTIIKLLYCLSIYNKSETAIKYALDVFEIDVYMPCYNKDWRNALELYMIWKGFVTQGSYFYH